MNQNFLISNPLFPSSQQLELVTPFQLYFNPYLIFQKFQVSFISSSIVQLIICCCFVFQVWRLVTTFLFFGSFGFNFMFNIIFTYRYCAMLEEGAFRTRTADFFYMFLFGAVLMSVRTHFLFPHLPITFVLLPFPFRNS